MRPGEPIEPYGAEEDDEDELDEDEYEDEYEDEREETGESVTIEISGPVAVHPPRRQRGRA